MNIERLKYSKCPNCKRRGLSGFRKTGYKYNPVLECEYCKKKFKVNRALSVTVDIGMAVIIGLIGQKTGMPLWICCIILLLLLAVFEYFAPLEEIEDKDKKQDN